jgi:hypothetical protein
MIVEPPTSCNDVGALFSACGFPVGLPPGTSGGNPGRPGSGGSSSGG